MNELTKADLSKFKEFSAALKEGFNVKVSIIDSNTKDIFEICIFCPFYRPKGVPDSEIFRSYTCVLNNSVFYLQPGMKPDLDIMRKKFGMDETVGAIIANLFFFTISFAAGHLNENEYWDLRERRWGKS